MLIIIISTTVLTKTPKLKHIAVKKMPPTRTISNQNVSMSNSNLDNLNIPYTQGSIEKKDFPPSY